MTAPPQGEGAKVAFRTKLSLLVSSCQFGHPGEGRGREMKSKKCERSMGGLESQSPGTRRDVRPSKAYRNSIGSRAPTSGTKVPKPACRLSPRGKRARGQGEQTTRTNCGASSPGEIKNPQTTMTRPCAQEPPRPPQHSRPQGLQSWNHKVQWEWTAARSSSPVAGKIKTNGRRGLCGCK